MAPAFPIEFIGQRESIRCSPSQLMGKSRKFSSKGPSSGFVPDYRHAVETIESEGFGSSGRIDTEMTASDDSSAPKKKCISLNVDGSGNFRVPTQVLSLAKMSRLERRDLKLKLKRELEQVENLQRKLACMSSDVIALSPSRDVRSWSEGQRKPPVDGFPRSSELSARNGKKRFPSARTGSQSKKGALGRSKSIKAATSANASNAMLLKQCEALLNRLMSHQYGWVFNTPVDIVELNIPDYFSVIKHPMDLGTVKKKLLSGEYASPLGFAADVRLTFSNAMTYNPCENNVHIMADTLRKHFESKWKAVEKKLPAVNDMQAVPEYAAHSETGIGIEMPPLKKKKVMPVDPRTKPEPEKRIMSDEEKHKLSVELEALLGELPESIVDFLKEQSSGAEQANKDEIEIDIDALGHETLFKLRKLLDDYLLDKQKKQAKAEPCEMEVHNMSGVSTSSVPPCKGNDAVDEDVDIVGGNDAPVSCFPPVEIEKDGVHRNSKCSSSSSSDADSASSSASESDAAKVSGPVTVTKEGMANGLSDDQKSTFHDFDTASVDGMGQVVQNSQPNPLPLEDDVQGEEENTPPERQVSPEKHYRAALVRSRFAETIFKAREKALEKVEKRDPEKLRMEREELERRAKEEKAKIQAEAKAAEEARRKAEAEVAAEAKRQRELERELARQALQKMEKTVDINENSQFMEDLEMLGVAPGEDLPNFLEEAKSPDLSENHLGSFKLQNSSNPLEQLGLYMKVDDEDEDDESEPPESLPVPPPPNDVEDGEID
ncbi:transcription factor GTE10-like isoform X2 [Syzygium oleosum]|uniref:transcription factor GTE10-like isoform X2 n=1 Tax=Syzygium oleosum TaxID=219896 RepID=UPI0024BA3DA0|nr:transcription factor GTE10-like isoform X2 [Syzygium oleosum]